MATSNRTRRAPAKGKKAAKKKAAPAKPKKKAAPAKKKAMPAKAKAAPAKKRAPVAPRPAPIALADDPRVRELAEALEDSRADARAARDEVVRLQAENDALRVALDAVRGSGPAPSAG